MDKKFILTHRFRGFQSIMVGKAWWEGSSSRNMCQKLIHILAVGLDTEDRIKSRTQLSPQLYAPDDYLCHPASCTKGSSLPQTVPLCRDQMFKHMNL